MLSNVAFHVEAHTNGRSNQGRNRTRRRIEEDASLLIRRTWRDEHAMALQEFQEPACATVDIGEGGVGNEE